MTSRYPAHWEYNDFAGVCLPPKFRPPFGAPRHPVRGGRWEIRKYPYGPEGKLWAAKTRGAASHLNRRFHTQAEAFVWAQSVAAVYAMKGGAEKDEAYFQLRVAKHGPERVFKGKFPDRTLANTSRRPVPYSR